MIQAPARRARVCPPYGILRWCICRAARPLAAEDQRNAVDNCLHKAIDNRPYEQIRTAVDPVGAAISRSKGSAKRKREAERVLHDYPLRPRFAQPPLPEGEASFSPTSLRSATSPKGRGKFLSDLASLSHLSQRERQVSLRPLLEGEARDALTMTPSTSYAPSVRFRPDLSRGNCPLPTSYSRASCRFWEWTQSRGSGTTSRRARHIWAHGYGRRAAHPRR